MTVQSLHHVAYRCKDAQQTVDFYTKVLGLKFTMAMAEDKVPSTREDCLELLGRGDYAALDQGLHFVGRVAQAGEQLAHVLGYRGRVIALAEPLAIEFQGQGRNLDRFSFGYAHFHQAA